MSMLTVLCTNGRRQQVKVQPNTKILEVIEEVCKKQGLNSNEYELVHHKKPVDIALSIRLSGVPNNAQLELRRSESGPRVYENVTLALQLDDGTRLEPLTFKPDTTSLLNVVEAYMDLPSTAAKCDYMKAVLDELTATRRGSYPTFSYLNEQIVGLYQIKNTTLKDMGLTHGRVIVRFSFRQIDGEQIAKMNDDFRAKLQKNAKLDEIFQKQVEEQKREEEERKKEEMKMSSSLVSLTESMVQESVAPLQQPPAPTPQPVAALQPSQLPQPQQAAEPFRPPRAIDRVQQQRPFDMDYEFVSSSSSSNKPNEFANFKFPEETKGQDLNNMNELAEIERESKRPCERKAILIYADREEFADVASATAREATTSQQADEPIDDDFYKVTIDDLKLMLRDLKRTQGEDQPLMTKQMRELEQDKRAMRYTQVVVRVVFKNRQTLQGLFRPKEPLSALYAFVQENLLNGGGENSSEDLDFYLFTTPPKIVLANTGKKNLFEAQLCPAALVYFKNKSDEMPRFVSSLTADMKTIEEADEIVREDVHSKIRSEAATAHEGMDWLKKEQMLAANLLKNSGLSALSKPTTSRTAGGGGSNDDDDSGPRGSREPATDVTKKKKLERFLKGSKK